MARGHLYEISTDRNDLGNMDESDFYNRLASISADYVQNKEGEEKEEKTAWFIEMLGGYGAETGKTDDGNESLMYFYVSDKVKQNYFRCRYEEFKSKSQDFKFSDFTDDRFKVWDIERLLHDKYNDAVYYDGVFMTIDTFLRAYAKDGERYYIGNVVFMH